MAEGTFLYDPKLGELARELREAMRSGRMKYSDAMDIMKKALKKSLEENATTFDKDGDN